MKERPEAIFLLGSSGNLGNSLARELRLDRRFIFEVVDYKLFLNGDSLSQERISWFQKRLKSYSTSTTIFATGVTNKTDFRSNWNSNFLFPSILIEKLSKPGRMFVTFGSIHEYTKIDNLYLETKRLLNAWLKENGYDGSVYQFKLHTLYGGHRIDSDMFLPQIIRSIASRNVFEMSNGLQLRKYHHVTDVSMKICEEIVSNSPTESILESGKYIRLIDLAQNIFSHFNLLELMKIHSTLSSRHEVYEPVVANCRELTFESRPLFPSMTDWISGWIK